MELELSEKIQTNFDKSNLSKTPTTNHIVESAERSASFPRSAAVLILTNETYVKS